MPEFKNATEELIYYLKKATPEQLKKFLIHPLTREVLGEERCEAAERSLQ